MLVANPPPPGALRRSRSTQEQLQADARPFAKRRRRTSCVASNIGRFVVNVESSLAQLLASEDTDNDEQITVDDTGPKIFHVPTEQSLGTKRVPIVGTYYLANLSQELYRSRDLQLKWTVLDTARVCENPVSRLTRLIQGTFWDNLTRTLDSSLIAAAAPDPKDWTVNKRPRIYVPFSEPRQYAYYCKVALERPDLDLDVQTLPSVITADVYRELNKKPGILALDMEPCIEGGHETLKGVPFIVPGGRFNELYYWDSYFTAIGLLMSDRIDLATGVLKNFIFEIQHYGLIPNANRSYYLLRSQPPFVTDLALRLYDATRLDPQAKPLLRRALLAAIKEYHLVWTSEPRLDPTTGLSRFRPGGLGVPLECEEDHFDHILAPYALKHGMSTRDFTKAYNSGSIRDAELDEYFLHDRAVRESGHDVSLRLERVCADLATVDLNCLLYKYERNLAYAIRVHFGNYLHIPAEFCAPGQAPYTISSSTWDRRATLRKRRIDRYLWNDEQGTYFDYDTVKRAPSNYESVTAFYALWSGVASPLQAHSLVTRALPLFESVGGLTVSTTRSQQEHDADCHPSHQWDYPYGWAPHQILAWEGLRRYGYGGEAERIAYRWLYLITKVFTEFNGAVCEKYDVTQTRNPHRVEAEYGNQGADFKGYAKEGFGWTNASYLMGLEILNEHMKRALSLCTPWETLEKGF